MVWIGNFPVSYTHLDVYKRQVQVEAQATYQGGTLMKTATAKVTMVAMTLETTYSVGNGLADGGSVSYTHLEL